MRGFHQSNLKRQSFSFVFVCQAKLYYLSQTWSVRAHHYLEAIWEGENGVRQGIGDNERDGQDMQDCTVLCTIALFVGHFFNV